jgi:hypothetical protein
MRTDAVDDDAARRASQAYPDDHRSVTFNRGVPRNSPSGYVPFGVPAAPQTAL